MPIADVSPHVGLAYKVASEYAQQWGFNKLDDFVSVAMEGLVHAGNRYNEDRGVEFSTYAWRTMAGHILHWLRDENGVIKAGRNAPRPVIQSLLDVDVEHDERSFRVVEMRELIRSCTDVQRQIIQLYFGEGFTQEAIAERLGIHQTRVSRHLQTALRQLRARLELSEA